MMNVNEADYMPGEIFTIPGSNVLICCTGVDGDSNG